MKKVKLLKRDRINHILLSIYDYPLTIVEAPMGFGKTTAVRSFLEAEKNPYFWIAFINSNESVDFLWNEFSSEIGKIDECAGKRLRSLGFPMDVPQTEKIVSILSNVDYNEKTVFVIDDYHLSQNTKLFSIIEQIILEGMDNLYIVIITRNTANINYTELFSRGKCQVISQQQLKFNEDEIHTYCIMNNNNISYSDLIKIKEYTDGWISLIYMMLLGLKEGIPVGMSSTINELVENALFNTYDEHIQNFLLKLSIMDNFTAKQAMFVTGEKKSDEILKKLHRENAFVYYDEVTQKYKIHNVLLDFLRMKQNFNDAELRRLYRRLGKWYLKEEPAIAYDYFNRAGDVEFILSEFNNPDNVNNELTEFKGSFAMFEKIPEKLLYKYPIAYLQHLLLSILKGNDETISDCSKRLNRLQQFYEHVENIDEEYRNRIIAETLIIKKFTAFNDIEKMGADSDRILKLLNGKHSCIMLRENEFTFGSPHILYAYFRKEGTFKKVKEIAISRFKVHAKISDGCGTGAEYLAASEYAFETGDFKTVELDSLKAVYKAKTKAQISIIICAYFNLIRFYIFQGRIAESLEKLKEIDSYVAGVSHSIYNTTVDLCKGYIYACLKQEDKIPYWLRTGDMSTADFFYQGMAFNYIVYGKAVMLSRNFIKLEMLSESFAECFSMFSNQLGFIHNGIFKAVAKYHLYGISKGISALEEVLSKAQSDNIIMPFAENAPYIMDMLEIIKNNNSDNKYIKKVFNCSKKYNENLDKHNLNKVKLSQREIQVLVLIAEGLKREDVAHCLTMSQGTVRTHLQHIYQKLGVSGKVAAIKIAKSRKII